MTANSDIMARAGELSSQISPGKALAAIGVFLEECFFGVFRFFGWLAGRVWFLVFVIGLALKDGFDSGRPHKLPTPPAPPELTANGFRPGPDHQGEPGPGNTYVYSERG